MDIEEGRQVSEDAYIFSVENRASGMEQSFITTFYEFIIDVGRRLTSILRSHQ